MKLVKSHYRSALTDEHLQLIFIVGNTNSEHHLSEMLSLLQKKRIPFADLYYKKYTRLFLDFVKKNVEICFFLLLYYCLHSVLNFASYSQGLKYLLFGFYRKFCQHLL